MKYVRTEILVGLSSLNDFCRANFSGSFKESFKEIRCCYCLLEDIVNQFNARVIFKGFC